MLQRQMSLPPLRVENSRVQTSDFSNGMNQNSGECGFEDFTFAASNLNQLYNNDVDDNIIHFGSLDEQFLNAGNTTWMRMSNENLKQVINKLYIISYLISVNSSFIYSRL